LGEWAGRKGVSWPGRPGRPCSPSNRGMVIGPGEPGSTRRCGGCGANCEWKKNPKTVVERQGQTKRAPNSKHGSRALRTLSSSCKNSGKTRGRGKKHTSRKKREGKDLEGTNLQGWFLTSRNLFHSIRSRAVGPWGGGG